MAITPEQAKQAQAIVAGWDEETQKSFKTRYKSADTFGKEKAITNILAKYSTTQVAPPSQEIAPAKNQMPYLGRLGQELSQAQEDFYRQRPEMRRSAEKGRLVKEIGGSIAVGAGTGAALRQTPFFAGKTLPLIKQSMLTAAEGAAGSQMISGSLEDRKRNAMMAAAVGAAVPPTVRGVGAITKPVVRLFPEALKVLNSGKNMSQQNVGAFREKIVSSVNSKMSQAGEEFGAVIDDLSTKSQTPVDLNMYAQEISDSMKDNPKIASIVRRVPGLSNLLESPNKTMSLSESQNLFKMISSKLKTTGGKIDFETRQALITLKNELRNAQIDSLSDDVLKAEFKVARQTWSKVKNDYDVIKRQFNVTNFENTVKTMFGDRNLLKEAMNRLSPQDLLEMSRASKAIKIGGYAKKAALTAIGGGLIGGAAKLGSGLVD